MTKHPKDQEANKQSLFGDFGAALSLTQGGIYALGIGVVNVMGLPFTQGYAAPTFVVSLVGMFLPLLFAEMMGSPGDLWCWRATQVLYAAFMLQKTTAFIARFAGRACHTMYLGTSILTLFRIPHWLATPWLDALAVAGFGYAVEGQSRPLAVFAWWSAVAYVLTHLMISARYVRKGDIVVDGAIDGQLVVDQVRGRI